MSNPVNDKETFYSTKTVGEMFDVKSETVIDWIERGLLPNAFKVHTRWKIPKSDALALAHAKYGKSDETPASD